MQSSYLHKAQTKEEITIQQFLQDETLSCNTLSFTKLSYIEENLETLRQGHTAVR